MASKSKDNLQQKQQVDLGVIGHGLDVTAISAPLFSTGNTKPRLRQD